MNPRARHWTAFTILAVCTFFSGASFVTYKASVLAQGPFAAGESSWFISAHNLAPRFLLGTLLLAAVYGARVLQLTGTEWRQAGFMALASFSGCILQNDGLQRTTAGTAAFLNQFYVILVPFWMALLHRRRPGAATLAATVLVMAGVGLVARVDWMTLRLGRGETELLLATVFFSLLLCSINWPAFAANRAERTSAAMFLMEGGMFAAVAAATVRAPVHLTAPFGSLSWNVLALAATLLGTAGPFLFINRWQRFVTPTEAGLLYSFGPVFAALAETVLPAPLGRWTGLEYSNQPLTAALVTGGGLILGANILVQLEEGRSAKAVV
ncbi:MAG: EamA family transporter [Verrucomicrobia bacterium]|nr:EamA family transporter [Verrucomicrobiota bacterium]